MKLSIDVSVFKRSVVALFVLSNIAIASAITVSPARLEVSGDPGKTISGDFIIVNDQNYAQTFYTSTENFEAQGESGTPSFSAANKDGLSKWIAVVDKIEVKAGDRVRVPFVVTIPANADAGGHFAAIFLTSAPPQALGSEVSIGSKVGMLMLLRVSGDIKEGGGVLTFKTKDDKTFLTSLPVHFSYRFSNDGNDRVNPTGVIAIKNTVGMSVVDINANKNQGNVLPKSVRRFDLTWGDATNLPSSASFFDSVRYQWRNFALGMYSADLDLTFGTSGTSKNTLTLYIFPWQLMLVMFIGLFVLYVIAHLVIKHHDKIIIEQIRRATRRVRRE